MFYRLIRFILFRFSPEFSHVFTLKLLALREKFFPYKKTKEVNPVKLMGIDFPSRVGLAAGLDKNGDFIAALAALGFGFVEVGTVTPEPQSGNPKPRLFRLVDDEAIINRMGFPNKGVDHLVSNLESLKHRPILGINIGKNKSTPISDAVNDYQICMQKVYPHADYIVLNISSPNTHNLRELQKEHELFDLLTTLKNLQTLLAHQHERYVPLVVKIAPDIDDEQLQKMAQVILATEMDGVIATNTTLSREGLKGHPFADEAGGLSGAPLKKRSLHIIKRLNQHLNGQIPIIGVGGIMTKHDAEDAFEAGASLVQVYTGLVYHGDRLIRQIAKLKPA